MTTKTRVLVVDDEPDLRELLKMILLKENWDVTEAENGSIAKMLITEQDFDLVISDIRMPEMNGLDLYKWNLNNKKIPTILITGFSMKFP
jgi:YesN/AraC family two-component response regulator